jgi:hypothetical protein
VLRDRVSATEKDLPILRCATVARASNRLGEAGILSVSQAVNEPHESTGKICWQIRQIAEDVLKFMLERIDVGFCQQD